MLEKMTNRVAVKHLETDSNQFLKVESTVYLDTASLWQREFSGYLKEKSEYLPFTSDGVICFLIQDGWRNLIFHFHASNKLIGYLLCPIGFSGPRLQLAMWLGQMKIFRTMFCTLCQKLFFLFNIQLCGFHCINGYSICILAIFPMYFY